MTVLLSADQTRPSWKRRENGEREKRYMFAPLLDTDSGSLNSKHAQVQKAVYGCEKQGIHRLAKNQKETSWFQGLFSKSKRRARPDPTLLLLIEVRNRLNDECKRRAYLRKRNEAEMKAKDLRMKSSAAAFQNLSAFFGVCTDRNPCSETPPRYDSAYMSEGSTEEHSPVKGRILSQRRW